jgi:hypothetical protein
MVKCLNSPKIGLVLDIIGLLNINYFLHIEVIFLSLKKFFFFFIYPFIIMSITKNMSRARNAGSAHFRSKASRFDWLLWSAINKNTTKRNNLANVEQTGSNVNLSVAGSTTTVKCGRGRHF